MQSTASATASPPVVDDAPRAASSRGRRQPLRYEEAPMPEVTRHDFRSGSRLFCPWNFWRPEDPVRCCEEFSRNGERK